MAKTINSIPNRNHSKINLWKALASCGLILGAAGITIGAVALALSLKKDNTNRNFEISKTSEVIPYEESYASTKITADFNKPGQEWAKWSIVDDGNPFYDPADHILSSNHLRLYPDDSLSSSTREVYRARYLNSHGITAPKEVHITVAADGKIKKTSIWLLPTYSDANVTSNRVSNLSFSFKATRLPNTYKKVPILQGGTDAINKSLELIHYKPDYDFSFEKPWSYNVQNYFKNNFDARDMALFFVLNLAGRLETAADNTVETIIIHNIALDPNGSQKKGTNFALDISSSFALANKDGTYTQEPTGFYEIQTSIDNTYHDNHNSFPSGFNYNACINAAYSNNPTSQGYGYQFNVSGSTESNLGNIYGWNNQNASAGQAASFVWNDSHVLSLYFNRVIWLTTDDNEGLEDALLMGTLFPSDN